jgi:hypothetical protein
MAIEPATDATSPDGHSSGSPEVTTGAQDMTAHVRDYSGFTRMFKWGAILAFLLGFVVVLIIRR